MQVELLNPFLTATTDVFRTMLGCEMKRGQLSLKRHRAPEYEVSGLIGLTGKYRGMVVVSLGRQTAINVTEKLLGDTHAELDADVIDTVGELANMIAGAAKAKLVEYQLNIGLPNVICGKNHSIGFPSNSTPFQLPFESTLGPVCIEVGMTNTAEAVRSG